MTSLPPPPDQRARDTVRTDLHHTLFVEAGAGTGKTTALVGRIVALARSGVPMGNIAAITFTEAAASELRDRVRTELEAGAEADDTLRDAAAQIDDAAISTLHAFAQRLISDHPLEVGLPPAIEVLDEIASSLEFEDRWTAFVDGLHHDPSAEVILQRAFATGLKFDQLRTVAQTFDDQRDLLPATPPPTPPAPSDFSLTELMAHLDRLEEFRQAGPQDPGNALARKLATISELRARLARAEGTLDALGVLAAIQAEQSGDEIVKVGTSGDKRLWPDKSAIGDVAEKANTAAEAVLGGARREVLAHLLHRIDADARSAAQDRLRRGRLVFHDLLIAARDLLRGSAEVRRVLAERYRYLLVDEFQDTDPLQVELAILLATTVAEVDDRSWDELAIGQGRLFFVGDPKQSIYRFRRADIDLFLRVQRHVTTEPLRLSANFRSDPGILDWVNATFASLMHSEQPGQATYHSLKAGREPDPEATGVPVWTLGHAHPKNSSIATIRTQEAAELAATIAELVGSWRVVDAKRDASGNEVRRPARWDDVAVLLPTRISLPYLEQAFDDADVPYRVETSSLVWGTQQVLDLLAVLQAVDDPTDEVALVASLRSDTLGCSDDDLLAYRVAGGRWSLTAPAPESLPESHPVLVALRLLRTLHQQRFWLGVSSLVDTAVRELGLFELAVDRRRPRDHWRRLRFVVDQARRFEDTPAPTLRGFLRWAEQQGTAAARVHEPVLPETDDDAVRILTVHGSKGLEFPVVVLAGINRRPDARTGKVLWDRQGAVQASVNKLFETPGFGHVRELEQEMSRLERHRLLYVATTRARDHLILSVHRPNDRKGSETDAQLLLDAAEAGDAVHQVLEAPTFRLQPTPGPEPTPGPDDDATARQRWDAERAEILGRQGGQPVVAATAVAGEEEKAEVDAELAPRRRGRAGTAIGRAVHATLQAVDLTSGDDLDAVAAGQAAAEDLTGKEAAVVAPLARAALDSPVVREAVGHRHWREVYVAAPVAATASLPSAGDGESPVTLEGFIDLLYEGPDGLVVVDYKTDAPPADATVARYRTQLGAYALAIETTLGRPVAAAALLFVGGGEAHTHWIPDLPAAVEEVRARLAARAGAGATDSA